MKSIIFLLSILLCVSASAQVITLSDARGTVSLNLEDIQLVRARTGGSVVIHGTNQARLNALQTQDSILANSCDQLIDLDVVESLSGQAVTSRLLINIREILSMRRSTANKAVITLRTTRNTVTSVDTFGTVEALVSACLGGDLIAAADIANGAVTAAKLAPGAVRIDTASLTGTTLNLSLTGDAQPARTVNLSALAAGFAVNEYASPGSYTLAIPAGAATATVICVGAGGGGGSGRVGAAGSNRGGGGGGGAGSVSIVTMPLISGQTQFDISVGTGGNPGGARSLSFASDGDDGASGGVSSVTYGSGVLFARAAGGGGGGGGRSSSAATGGSVAPSGAGYVFAGVAGGAGGFPNASTNVTNTGAVPTGGGGGGGMNAGNTFNSGASSGHAWFTTVQAIGGATQGASGASASVFGNAYVGSGGGGGASSHIGNAGAGGAGVRGGGGGGGGSSTASIGDSGAGGVGGHGYVLVIFNR